MRSLCLVFVLLFAVGCRKDQPVQPSVSAPVKSSELPELILEFYAHADGKELKRDSVYKTPFGDHFTVTLFNYYISIVQLIKNDSVFSEPESYHLISHLDGNTSFTISGIPPGDYKELSFLVGVDSARNVSGAQSGALDPLYNMFWDWNTGYIFYKLEGWYRSISSAENNYGIHVGGFSGRFNALQTIKLPCDIKLKNGDKLHLVLGANVSELFRTPHQLDFDTYSQQIQENDMMQRFSQNYSDMFTVQKTTYLK